MTESPQDPAAVAASKTSKYKPFHESVVQELKRLATTPAGSTGGPRSALDFESVCTLIATTKIPKGHIEVRRALENATAGIAHTHPWLEAAFESINGQDFEVIQKSSKAGVTEEHTTSV